MGRASRAKRDRREAAGFAAALTSCADTWLERPPDATEQGQIAAARRTLSAHRAEAIALSSDYDALLRLSLDIFRDPRFEPLHFDDWVVEQIIAEHGEPPVVEDASDPAFSDYLRAAVLGFANGRVRRALSDQVRRYLPEYVEENRFREALAIEHNAYMTVMSDAATPLLVQMLVGALARWYEEHEEDDDDVAEVDAAESDA